MRFCRLFSKVPVSPATAARTTPAIHLIPLLKQGKPSHPSQVTTLIAEVPNLTKFLDASQTATLATAMANCSINNAQAWNSLETSICRRLLTQLSGAQLADLLKAFQKAKQGSSRLWNALEGIILTKLAPELSASAIGTVLRTYSDSGSVQLLRSLEEQVIAKAKQYSSYDLAQLAWTFSMLKALSEPLVTELEAAAIAQAGHFRSKDAMRFIHALARARTGTLEVYDALEPRVVNSHLTLEAISGVAYAYARHTPLTTRAFLNFLAESAEKHLDLIKDCEAHVVVHLLWAILKCDIQYRLPLWHKLVQKYATLNLDGSHLERLGQQIDKRLPEFGFR